MKKTLILTLSICLVALFVASASARVPGNAKLGISKLGATSGDYVSEFTDPGLRSLYQSAAVDTYCLVWYNFESNNWQGWTRQDVTAQVDTFFHADDFAGLSGGRYGRLVPISGSKSAWCGARAGTDQYMCGWTSAPGYGNNWDQVFVTDAFYFSGSLTFSYKGVFDSEPGYDYTYVEYDAGGNTWMNLATYTGVVDTTALHTVLSTQARTKLRFHFVSDGGWSDEDGSWSSDGAAILDDILVVDSGSLINNTETFESASVGAVDIGIWHARPTAGFGKYSGLMNNLTDKDPCGDNFGTQVVFFVGSPDPSTSYPGLFDTPFCLGGGGTEAPCQYDLIVSPVIDLAKYSTARNSTQDGTIPTADLPLLGGTDFRFTVYRDVDLPDLAFYVWHVRSVVDGCASGWVDRNTMYYGADMDYIQSAFDVGDLIEGTKIQVALGVRDMCDIWYLQYGNCSQHTPSPWIDNVRLYRYKTTGPQWSYRSAEMFQDNFPSEEFNLESYVRADAGWDVRAGDDPVVDPGDSIVVSCSSPLGGGLAADPAGGPAIYMHVKCSYIGVDLAKPAKLAGPQFQGTYGRYVSDDGTWTIIQGDTARFAGQATADNYMFDLNDSLFTRGYKIEYYFKARDVAGYESIWPRRNSSGSAYVNLDPLREFTCLPTKNSDILFVNDFGERPDYFLIGTVRAYWEPVFAAVLPPNNQPDIYDVNDADGGQSNGPGSRAKNKHLIDQYNVIVWDTGDLPQITIADGTVASDKSNDCQMLMDWMNLSEHRCGLWVCGDDVAHDLSLDGSAQALAFMSTWCGVEYVENSYYELTGGRTGGGTVTPLLTGNPLGIFNHGGALDDFYGFAGCPIINSFDVLEKTANGEYALDYPTFQGTVYHAGIQSINTNAAGYTVRSMWFGFSYQYVRSDDGTSPADRFEIARDVLSWLQAIVNSDITPTDVPGVNSLAQNFPNPFNPSTTIRYDLKDKGLVTLRVYNVAGQLVRTLVNGVKDAGAYSLTWDGMNDRGGDVASGIYFYKMETKGFSETKKMVLLR